MILLKAYIPILILLKIGIKVTLEYDVWLATGRWFSPGLPVSSTNKTDRHDITEIVLKMTLNTIKQANKHTHTYIYTSEN